MKSFEYVRPTKLDDAMALLSDRSGETQVLAGGTDLVTSLKQNLLEPKRLVSLKGIEGLSGIEIASNQARIGAMTTLAEVAEHAEIQKHFPSIVQAIVGIGSPQIVNMATLGGDLCQRPRCWYYRQGFGLLGQLDGKPLVPEGDNRYHAVFGNQGPAYFVSPSTPACALIALDATLSIAGPGGKTRQLKVAEFFRIPMSAGERENVLEPNEILAAVTVPIAGWANATYEVRERVGIDWPLVTASVAFESGEAARRASVVLGLVAPVPWPATKAAAILEGKKIDEALAAQAGQAAADGATPLSRNGYKVQLVKTAVRRAILRAAGLTED